MSEMVLRMPSSYVDVESDEMEYIDGGGAFYSSVYGLGGLLLTMGALAWSVGSFHGINKMASNGLLMAIGGAALVGSLLITTIEMIAWNKVKMIFRNK